MKKNTLLSLLLLLSTLLLLSACGPNLREYFGHANGYQSAVSTNAQADIWVDSEPLSDSFHGLLGPKSAFVVNALGHAASTAIHMEQRPRIQRLLDPITLAMTVDESFEREFTNVTQIPVVPEEYPHDIGIHIKVLEYGLYAASIIDPMSFYIRVKLDVIHRPSMKRIYEDYIALYRDQTELQRTGYLGHDVIAAVFNLKAFFKLSDAELQQIFAVMAQDAGAALANRLVTAIYD